jgi:hypothetical protein
MPALPVSSWQQIDDQTGVDHQLDVATRLVSRLSAAPNVRPPARNRTVPQADRRRGQ